MQHQSLNNADAFLYLIVTQLNKTNLLAQLRLHPSRNQCIFDIGRDTKIIFKYI
jgi:hypothetical protein